jgi:hypothetical protein
MVAKANYFQDALEDFLVKTALILGYPGSSSIPIDLPSASSTAMRRRPVLTSALICRVSVP